MTTQAKKAAPSKAKQIAQNVHAKLHGTGQRNELSGSFKVTDKGLQPVKASTEGDSNE
ncbi:hypothetical protein [Pseudoalteromonas sp. BDTF-M6]|uniref:hypothetical protein n=1 Tax=Pseudoalteromonas sp. BDTF-M6 TaxID=2796132 RepID=UPI001BAF8A67|nr:hypothetical protein [Pseudoalteromonas sp. BDTF-M6]MBS3796675.1 hypothetical protein [Pseudoalteromonas sp. BDTF-M6]